MNSTPINFKNTAKKVRVDGVEEKKIRGGEIDEARGDEEFFLKVSKLNFAPVDVLSELN